MKHTIKTCLLALLFCTVAGIIVGCSQQKQRPTPRELDDDMDEDVDDDKVYVPFARTENNLIEVKGEINGVPLNMCWDTGTSLTSISRMELDKMAKENRISDDDFVGISWSQLADGSVTIDARFKVKHIVLPGRDNKEVRVDDILILVSDNEDAPVLLGSDVISRLGKHTFDESEGVIIFE